MKYGKNYLVLAAVAVMMIAVPSMAMASSPPSTSSSGVHTMNFGDIINAGEIPHGSTMVLQVTYKVINDEDSGNSGYWAMDNYTKSVQVWESPGGTYYVIGLYSGTWTTYAGALSPKNGAPESMTASGTFHGGYIATFSANGVTGSSGHLGIKNYNGTVGDIKLGTYSNQVGPASVYDFLTALFNNPSGFTYINWGWTYQYHSQTWNDFLSGESGDIVV